MQSMLVKHLLEYITKQTWGSLSVQTKTKDQLLILHLCELVSDDEFTDASSDGSITNSSIAALNYVLPIFQMLINEEYEECSFERHPSSFGKYDYSILSQIHGSKSMYPIMCDGIHPALCPIVTKIHMLTVLKTLEKCASVASKENALTLYIAATELVLAVSEIGVDGLSASLMEAMMRLNKRLLYALGEFDDFG